MSNEYPFRNLVFEGGGTLGVAYVGVMEELEKRKILNQVVRAGGASAGAINALLFVLGYSSNQVWDELLKLDFNTFLDFSWPFKLDSLYRLFKAFGLYRGDVFKSWISGLVVRKNLNPRITFRELKKAGYRDLYLVGTNLNTSYYDIYSWEHTPDMSVVDAVRISMSIPLMFAAVHDALGNTDVDGGVLNNYPVRLFDQGKYIDLNAHPTHATLTKFYKQVNRAADPSSFQYLYNRETLGFRLSSPQNLPVGENAQPATRVEIRSLFNYLARLVAAFRNVQNNSHLETEDWHRTIFVDTLQVDGFNFHIDTDTKKRLAESGRQGVINYFKWYDNAKDGSAGATADVPYNRPDYKKKLKKQ
jgi:NTE family protein